MLRLPPTRIIFDAQDVEYHTLNSQEKIKQLVSRGFEKKVAFNHLFPRLNKLRASIANQVKDDTSSYSRQDGRSTAGKQVLRNTVSSDTGRDILGSSLDDTVDTEPTKAGFLSIDGQNELVMRSAQQTDFDIFKLKTIPKELSTASTTTDNVTSSEIERITSRLQGLAQKRQNSNSNMMHEYEAPPIESGSDHPSMPSQTEPRLPTPFSHRAQMASMGQILPIRTGGAHYSSPSQYVLHASPAEPAYHSSPMSSLYAQSSQPFTPTHYPYSITQSIPYTISRSGPTSGIGRVYSVPDMAQQHYYTNPLNGTEIPTQGTGISISPSNLPRIPRGYGRPDAVEDYTDVFDFGQSTDYWNRFRTSRNAHARQRNELFIYEDDLPPGLQPQTPVRLPRHGIPHSLGGYPLTAPPAPRSRPSVLQPMTPTRSDRHQPSMIPGTSNSRFISDNDQENAAMYAEIERRRQMRTAAHIAMRQGGELLDTTPPRLSEDDIV